MRKYIRLLFLSVLFSGCNDNLDSEMYKKLVYLTQNGYQQSFLMISDEASQQAISVYCGGSSKTDKDIEVTLKVNPEALAAFNEERFDSPDAYYELLPDSAYSIENYHATIRKNEEYGLMPVKIFSNKIAPRKKYILPLSIESVSDYEINEDLRTLLFDFFLINKYYGAYRFIGTAVEEGKTSKARINREQTMIVAGENEILFHAESKTYEKDGDKFLIRAIINEDNSITMTSDNQDVLQVENCEPFPGETPSARDNRYDPETNTMRLVYKYFDQGKTNKKRIVVCDLSLAQ